MSDLVSAEIIATKIFVIRSKRVMLDSDLALFYDIETKYLTRQVKRNLKRFPEDFMFRLTKEEFLRCQNVTSTKGGRRYLPYVFTEQGVSMLSSVLNSDRAITVNIQIMRAFVKIREFLLTHKELAEKIELLEKKYSNHDESIKAIFEVIKQLLEPVEEKEKPKIGFK